MVLLAFCVSRQDPKGCKVYRYCCYRFLIPKSFYCCFLVLLLLIFSFVFLLLVVDGMAYHSSVDFSPVCRFSFLLMNSCFCQTRGHFNYLLSHFFSDFLLYNFLISCITLCLYFYLSKDSF